MIITLKKNNNFKESYFSIQKKSHWSDLRKLKTKFIWFFNQILGNDIKDILCKVTHNKME